MPISEPLRIFISYAVKDGTALAQRLQASLKDEGLDAWLGTQRLVSGAVCGAQRVSAPSMTATRCWPS